MGDDPLALISGLERKDEVFALLRDFLSDIHLYLQQRSQFCDSKVAYVQQALEERFQDPSLTLQQLSDELHVTANYLGILYKKECGESFVAELTARRIDYAKQLLVTTQWRIHKISVDCGFSDPKYFAATFRRATTLTPSEYRSRFYGSAPQFDRKRC
jgi:two-component system response regulator YesN